MELEWKVSDSRDEECSVWVVSAPFCVMRFINDPCYLLRNKGAKSGGIEARKPSVQFIASKTVWKEDFKKHKLLQMVALLKSKVDKEHSLNYGEKFILLHVDSRHVFEESRMRTDVAKYTPD